MSEPAVAVPPVSKGAGPVPATGVAGRPTERVKSAASDAAHIAFFGSMAVGVAVANARTPSLPMLLVLKLTLAAAVASGIAILAL